MLVYGKENDRKVKVLVGLYHHRLCNITPTLYKIQRTHVAYVEVSIRPSGSVREFLESSRYVGDICSVKVQAFVVVAKETEGV